MSGEMEIARWGNFGFTIKYPNGDSSEWSLTPETLRYQLAEAERKVAELRAIAVEVGGLL